MLYSITMQNAGAKRPATDPAAPEASATALPTTKRQNSFPEKPHLKTLAEWKLNKSAKIREENSSSKDKWDFPSTDGLDYMRWRPKRLDPDSQLFAIDPASQSANFLSNRQLARALDLHVDVVRKSDKLPLPRISEASACQWIPLDILLVEIFEALDSCNECCES